MLIARRTLLRGLFAAPAIVAVGNLMPLRGVRWSMDEMLYADMVQAIQRESFIPAPVLKRIVIDTIKYREQINEMVRYVERQRASIS